MSTRRRLAIRLVVFTFALVASASARAQDARGGPPLPLVQLEGPAGPPVVVTLQDALDRAAKLDVQFQATAADAQIAREDRVQAKASLLPSLSQTTQYLGNSPTPNDVNPNGRYVSLDGVKMYRVWAVAHEEISANTILMTPYRRAQAAQAAAEARLEIAQRGLAVTVTRNYYALVTAERRYASAQQAAQQAQRFSRSASSSSASARSRKAMSSRPRSNTGSSSKAIRKRRSRLRMPGSRSRSCCSRP